MPLGKDMKNCIYS